MVILRYVQRSLVVAALLGWAGSDLPAHAQTSSDGCLYALSHGAQATPIDPCPETDPLNLANDPDIQKVMRVLGIEPSQIRFKGCSGLRFSAAPDVMANGVIERYLITYPIEAAQSYLAPVTHELAHVLQMEMAGGLDPLREALGSRRIELGADYLAGVIFSNALQNIHVNQFQHNLSLMGRYIELDALAHGTPSQRTAAFRLGVYLNFNDYNRNIRMVSDHFQSDEYGNIVQL